MHRIRYTAAALKALVRMPRNTADLIRAKIAEVAADPAQARNVKKLQGRAGYRLRVGDWRVLYELRNGELVLVVIKVAPRGEAYD